MMSTDEETLHTKNVFGLTNEIEALFISKEQKKLFESIMHALKPILNSAALRQAQCLPDFFASNCLQHKKQMFRASLFILYSEASQ